MQVLANKQRAKASTARTRAPLRVKCVASLPSRRDALIGAGIALASPLILTKSASAEEGGAKYGVKYVPVDSLGTFQKADQRNEFRTRAEQTIKKYLGADDARACVRLALLDAGDYDIATKTGGFNGSIIQNPPSSVTAVVEKLRKAKQAIDEGDKNGSGPISWADLIYLAGKTTTQAAWNQQKSFKAGSEAAVAGFANPWTVTLGRVDSDVAGPNKVPAADAPVEEIRAYLLALGAKPADGPFAPKPPFWEKPGFVIWTAAAEDPAAEEARFAAANPLFADVKASYDRSRRTVTSTNYEIDFAEFYNRLTSLGAKFNPKAYLYPQAVLDAKL